MRWKFDLRGPVPLIKYLKPQGRSEVLIWIAGIAGVALAAWLLSGRLGTVLDPALARPFATTVLGFETAVVAIAIPTALNVVGRLYEKYASNRMRDALLQGLPLIRLALVAFSTIFLLILVISGAVHTTPFLEWLTVLGVLTSAALLFSFLDTVVHFVVNEPFAAVDLMARRLRKELAAGVSDYASDDTYVTAVQGIGDILAYAAVQGTQDSTVDDCLAALWEPVESLLDLRERDYDAYLSAVLRTELRSEGTDRLDSALTFFPEATLAGFMLPVEQVVRGFRRACEGGNDEAGRKAVDWLTAILARLVADEGRKAEVLAVLKQFWGMTGHAVANGRPALQSAAAYGWYFHLLFPGEASPGTPIHESYLRPVVEAAFPCLRLVVRESPQEVFGSFCAHAADWAFESDVSASGTARRASLDELSFAVAAYALAAGRPDYVLELLDYGRRAVAYDADFGRETLPSSPAKLLESWAGSWSNPGLLERFDGLATSSVAKRRLLALLLARAGYRAGSRPSGQEDLPAEERELLARACRELSKEPAGTLNIVGPRRTKAQAALRAVADILEASPRNPPMLGEPKPDLGHTSQFKRVLGLGEADPV